MNDAMFEWPDGLRFCGRPPLQPAVAFADHVVVVLFWQLGCVHSRAALLETALATLAEADDAIVAVAVCVAPVGQPADDAFEARVQRALLELPLPLTAAVLEREAADAAGLPGARLPAMAVVDHLGFERARAAGVPRRANLRDAVQGLLVRAREQAGVVSPPFAALVDHAPVPLLPRALAWDGERFWLASAGRRQVLLLTRDGDVERLVGSGDWGTADGEPATAQFGVPDALLVHGEHVVVADVHGHTLRAIEVETGCVETWCGSGWLGSDDMGGAYGRDQALSSPAGMVARDGGIYLCHPGTGQVWQIDPMTGAAMAWLGGSADGGPLRQPVAVADDEGEQLWLAEAAAGAISVVDLAHVERRVFVSGLGRPVGLLWFQGRLLVADADRAEVLELDVAAARVTVVLGPQHGLREPVALASDGERLFVVDAGRDAVLVGTPPGEAQLVRELVPWPLRGLDVLEPASGHDWARLAEPLLLAEYSDVTLSVSVAAWPELVDGTSASVEIVDEAEPTLAAARDAVAEVRGGRVELLVPIAASAQGAWRLRVRCGERTLRAVVPVTVRADGATEAELRWRESCDG